MANIYDGVAGKPGFVYQGYAQLYQTNRIYNANGDNTGSLLKVNSLLSLHQLIYLTPVKVLGGNLGFTVLVPIVRITATNTAGPAPSVNPDAVGDIVQGTAIQWSDRKLFGKVFWHRLEADVNIPTGSYNSNYAINASSHLWAIGVYHAFTLFLNKNVTLSARNQFNYNFRIIDKPDKPGACYNGNYSIDVSLLKDFKLEVAAYYLTQITEDSYDGDHNYYQNRYQLSTTKERVLGFGPGLAYFLPGGILIEGKVFFEAAAKNTSQGTRPTLRIAIPFPGKEK
ncbi:hypothetical protein GCM10011511_50060 [Puia dinghuensis]|uniref:Transporter n=1 Tax=Puia dinghuensis TaxID=1792502 RepID=A0A8J2XTU1_9BACT|nr:hypothetical protein GCM10011511_50060 [Puia dinghuensis]